MSRSYYLARSYAWLRAPFATLVLALLFGMHGQIARADDKPVDAAAIQAQADALFASGKAAMAEQNYPLACSLLHDSYRLDPATGSLLALAICHEWEGKLASALREYTEVVARSQAEARPDRERAASERVTGLQGVVSTLTLRTSQLGDAESIDGLRVRIDEALIDPSLFNAPIPVDGGGHVVSASAPGKPTFTAEVTMGAHHDVQLVSIPAFDAKEAPLVAQAKMGRSVPFVKPIERPAQEDVEPREFTALQWAGTSSLTAGLLTLGAGGLLTLSAIHDNNVKNSGCDDQGCVENPPQKTLTLGPAANITLAAGGVLTATGIVLLIVGRRSSAVRVGQERALLLTPWAAKQSAGAAVHGSF